MPLESRAQSIGTHCLPNAEGQPDAEEKPPTIASELERAAMRRSTFGVRRPAEHESEQWALAFSGGGIRSATFCLGVLQGLVKSAPPSPEVGGVAGRPENSAKSLLPHFDYLSTVSGGGYCGSFFGSLFASDRLDPTRKLDDRALAQQAYKVFEAEPPGRLRSNVVFDPAAPGKGPLAWLRENGRYMAPTGSGDMVYAMALAIRNWFAMHYVLGTVMLTAFTMLALIRALLIEYLPDSLSPPSYQWHEVALLQTAQCNYCATSIWWSPIWWLLLPLLALWLIPAGIAFWLTQPPEGGKVSVPAQWRSFAPESSFFIGLILCAIGMSGLSYLSHDWKRVVVALICVGVITIFGSVWHFMTTSTAYGRATISEQRVTLTRGLARGFLWLAAIVLLAAVDTTSQSLYANLSQVTGWLTSTAGTGAIVWIVRHLATTLAEKEREGLLSKIPVNAIITVTGLVLLFLVALFWSMLVMWIQWQGTAPNSELLTRLGSHREVLIVLGATAILALVLTWISSQFPGFLNLSTLQGLYSARLTRAYLGASNGLRFASNNAALRSVAEPAPGDHISHDEYYKNPLMPIHIINVCVNQNSDPAEQLVQRDRKGKPLAILPGGFSLDGKFCNFPRKDERSELDEELTIGEWVGVSGAAFSTGLGRRTTLGYSLLMGLANVRLGRWWRSGITSEAPDSRGKDVRETFKTQAYLFDELFATFYGTRRPLQYLSDGGHFENTSAYELLRQGRNVRLIVLCDCGCDPKYEFDDLANLARLVRIDFGIEVEVDREAATTEHLQDIFGTPEDFLPTHDNESGSKNATKCALLLKVFSSAQGSREIRKPDAYIIVLKPRLIPSVAIDLAQYRSTHPAFPQEPTADQFYDEAQWESYRRLGMEIARRVFGVEDEREAYRKALWKRVLISK